MMHVYAVCCENYKKYMSSLSPASVWETTPR